VLVEHVEIFYLAAHMCSSAAIATYSFFVYRLLFRPQDVLTIGEPMYTPPH
jgi:hypothetical protein